MLAHIHVAKPFTAANNSELSSRKFRVQCASTSVRNHAAKLKDDLLKIIDGQRFGADTTQQQKEQVSQLVDQLKQSHTTSTAAAAAAAEATANITASSSSSSSSAAQQQPLAPTEGSLDGDWVLLWTTEAAVHQLVRGQLLGIPVKDIRQSIDLRQKRVVNTIVFGLLGFQLQASGPLTVLNSSRIYYSFDSIVLGLLGLKVRLPLFIKGGGWTDCVVMQDGVRVMENSRRDTLILQRLST